MEINNIQLINQQALIIAAQALQSEDAQMLQQLGLVNIEEGLAAQLKSLSVDRLSNVSKFKGAFCQIRFDVNALRLCLGFVEGKSREDDMINRAIRAGLRQPMLESLKGISRREYNQRRERLGLPLHSKGRIEVLNEEDELKVLRAWDQLDELHAPLERFLALHETTGISLDRAWVCLQELA